MRWGPDGPGGGGGPSPSEGGEGAVWTALWLDPPPLKKSSVDDHPQILPRLIPGPRR